MKPHSWLPITCKAGLVGCQVLLSRGACQGPETSMARVSSGPGPRQSCRLSLCCRGGDRCRHFVIQPAPKQALPHLRGHPEPRHPGAELRAPLPGGAVWAFEETLSAACPRVGTPLPWGWGGGWGRVPRWGCPPLDHMPFFAFSISCHPWALSAGSGRRRQCSSRGLGPGGDVSGSGQQSLAGG